MFADAATLRTRPASLKQRFDRFDRQCNVSQTVLDLQVRSFGRTRKRNEEVLCFPPELRDRLGIIWTSVFEVRVFGTFASTPSPRQCRISCSWRSPVSRAPCSNCSRVYKTSCNRQSLDQRFGPADRFKKNRPRRRRGAEAGLGGACMGAWFQCARNWCRHPLWVSRRVRLWGSS